MIRAAAPAPWNIQLSGKPGSNGDLNMYITDKDGRKIAAVWGKRGEKDATACIISLAPDLLALVKRYRAETPLGHQPHMIAHEADAIIAAAEVPS